MPWNYFNPRSREGSDDLTANIIERFFDFNPRSREGSDLIKADMLRSDCAFQSALPRRERRTNQRKCQFHGNFNPRSREGSDVIVRISPNSSLLFQSALPRRERQQYYTTIFIFLYNTVYFVSNNIK